MWKPSQDVKGGGGADESKFYDRPSQRRRWDSLADPKLLPSDLEYSPPRSSRWDASTQVPSERRLQQRPKICLEYKSSSSRPLQWDVSTQVPSEPKSRPSHIVEHHSSPSRPARIAGGNGCNCCPCPPTPCERPVESCLPGLHQKYVDVYDTKGHAPEGHLPAGYRRFVEHDDLYLPPSRALSPASTDHDDLYLPLKTNEYSPRDCCPCDLRMCDSDPTYGDIYLPPSRPCTPAFPKDPCGYQPPCPPPCCPPPPCRPCPPPPCSPPPRQSSCGPKIVCSCPPYIKKLAPCPAPPSNDCSCSPYIKKLSGKCSAGPPPSSRCQSCDCHKGGSSSNKCGGPPKVSPKLLEDPCCSPCRPSPCRPLLAAEMLSGMEACVSQAKACGANPASCMDTRCGSCDCHKPKCPPPPSPPCSPCSKPSPPPCRAPPPSCSPCRSPGPSCFDDDVHNPTFKSFQSTSPRCKDCDCHKPKNCKLSSQICKFCRGAGWCYCEYHTTLQLLTDSNSEPQTSPHHDKNSMEVEETVVSQVSGISPENTYRSSDLSARSAKLEYNESPRDEEIEQISRSPMKDIPSQSDIIQLCCCGECEYTKPRFPMKTECPFCKHTHSCCCGMCSCPIPTCSSKTPLDGPLSRGVSVNSSGALTGRSNPPLYSYRPKSVSQQLAPRKKLGFTSPDKSTPKTFTTSNSQLSNARLCYSSPKTRMKQSPTRR
ncbi:hypothetical protein KC19_4G253300 [Ceratodon purpureus]|uniref:Uncharacterized protein n=1 Tax=Ceratodon purpureus TaxID=3225 RepID=A0A8T0IEL1_CERPU|nr:hypothetical protein KC19_4G253300 [Ceratodon purpureus]